MQCLSEGSPTTSCCTQAVVLKLARDKNPQLPASSVTRLPSSDVSAICSMRLCTCWSLGCVRYLHSAGFTFGIKNGGHTTTVAESHWLMRNSFGMIHIMKKGHPNFHSPCEMTRNSVIHLGFVQVNHHLRALIVLINNFFIIVEHQYGASFFGGVHAMDICPHNCRTSTPSLFTASSFCSPYK